MTQTLVQRAVVKTNTIKGSVCKIDVPVVTFADLWENYVTGDPYKPAPSDKGDYSNQCALRMSATFHKIGIKMLSFSQRTVKPMPGAQTLGRVIMDSTAAAVRAYELGEWLKLQPFCGLPKQPENITGKDWASNVKGRTGIIMFHAYWAREGEASTNASGGHIDLWNKDTLTPSPESFLRFRLGVNRLWNPISLFGRDRNLYSDLGQSKLILFWEIR